MIKNNRSITEDTRFNMENRRKAGEKKTTSASQQISLLYRGEVTTPNDGLQEVYIKVKPLWENFTIDERDNVNWKLTAWGAWISCSYSCSCCTLSPSPPCRKGEKKKAIDTRWRGIQLCWRCDHHRWIVGEEWWGGGTDNLMVRQWRDHWRRDGGTVERYSGSGGGAVRRGWRRGAGVVFLRWGGTIGGEGCAVRVREGTHECGLRGGGTARPRGGEGCAHVPLCGREKGGGVNPERWMWFEGMWGESGALDAIWHVGLQGKTPPFYVSIDIDIDKQKI